VVKAAKRPSYYLMAACFLLLISAAVGLSGGAAEEDPALSALRARGWAALDHVECAGLTAGDYFEVSSEKESAEIYYLGASSLASRAPLPEPPYECRKIPKPHFVEEI
jgi:hypothetical protein